MLGTLVAATPAAAMHDQDDDPDNQDHYVWRDTSQIPASMETNVKNATDWGTGALDSQTQLITHVADHLMDVRVLAGYTPGNYGDELCTEMIAGTRFCQYSRVRYDYDATASLSGDQWKSLGCHELGHTGGIRERTDSTGTCQYSGAAWPLLLDDHDIALINADWQR